MQNGSHSNSAIIAPTLNCASFGGGGGVGDVLYVHMGTSAWASSLTSEAEPVSTGVLRHKEAKSASLTLSHHCWTEKLFLQGQEIQVQVLGFGGRLDTSWGFALFLLLQFCWSSGPSLLTYWFLTLIFKLLRKPFFSLLSCCCITCLCESHKNNPVYTYVMIRVECHYFAVFDCRSVFVIALFCT